MTNFLRVVKAVTPFIPAEVFSDELKGNVGKNSEEELSLSYSLSDIWEAFIEWSCYGRGVPTLLNEELVTQYYVPSLSAIQLYIDPFLSDANGSWNLSKITGISLDKSIDDSNSNGKLLYEFFETEVPYKRMSLTDKALSLASTFPELNTMKSCDLLSTSWISVAWYPIYRNSMASTFKELDACFLTYHSLSTHSTRYPHIKVNGGKKDGKPINGAQDKKPMIPLPVFGLTCYKYKGSLLCPNKDHECEKENSLLQAAEDWIRDRKVLHHDYEFFRSHQWM
ncbi:uncharacterized protein LOC124930138 [Impatiens glandulifera]|uniref:uncharacterized protein LOC124930138 n=1 Tax=Impatiens glandulifera TaxID=253017 RepID=UPI001FB0B546|nr:uncharacterized protein LOC124930138 [Impatiens glandulifera]